MGAQNSIPVKDLLDTARLQASADTQQTLSTATIGNANKATNLAGGVTFNIPYQTATDKTDFLPNTTTTQGTSTTPFILTQFGGNTPLWKNPGDTGFTVNRATHLAGGGAATIPYQTASGVTVQLPRPTTTGTFVLTNRNTGVPSWMATTSLESGKAANNNFQIGNWSLFEEAGALCRQWSLSKTCWTADKIAFSTPITVNIPNLSTQPYTVISSPSGNWSLKSIGSAFGLMGPANSLGPFTGWTVNKTISGTAPYTLSVLVTTKQLQLKNAANTILWTSRTAPTNAVGVAILDAPVYMKSNTQYSPLVFTDATGAPIEAFF